VGDELAGLLFLRDRALGDADAGAADEDALDAVLGPRRGERLVDAVVARHVRLAKYAADLGGDFFAALALQIENGDFRAKPGEPAGGRFAEAGGAAGDDRGDG
jgi:hypothetical protein